MAFPESPPHAQDGDDNNAAADNHLNPANQDGFWKNPNHWVAIATVVIAVANGFYTFFALKQWNTMKDMLSATKNQITLTDSIFTQDQRPYVMVKKVVAVPGSIAPGEYMQWGVVKTNYGKSPAMNVRGAGGVLIGMDALAQADKAFEIIGERLATHDSSRGLPPMTALDRFLW